MATLTRSALQNGNVECSRYRHTLGVDLATAATPSAKPQRDELQQRSHEPTGILGAHLVPTHCLSSAEQKLIWIFLMPFNTTSKHSILLLLPQGIA